MEIKISKFISVVIPVFNNKPFITKCIKSLIHLENIKFTLNFLHFQLTFVKLFIYIKLSHNDLLLAIAEFKFIIIITLLSQTISDSYSLLVHTLMFLLF